MVRKILAVGSAAFVLASSAAAQAAGPQQVLSIQPLNAMFEVFSGEFERTASKATTWGVGGNHWGIGEGTGEVNYTSGEFKVRYYPAGVALKGFSFGGGVGFANVSGKSGSSDESASGATIAVLLEYQWIMGDKQNFSVALGLGAKKLMMSDDEITSSDFTVNYPTGRISIGLAW